MSVTKDFSLTTKHVKISTNVTKEFRVRTAFVRTRWDLSFVPASQATIWRTTHVSVAFFIHLKRNKFDVLISIDVHITLIILVFYLQMSTSAPIRLASTAHASINRAPICVSASQDLRWREMFA